MVPRTSMTMIASATTDAQHGALHSEITGLMPDVIRPILPLTRSLSRKRLRFASQVRQVAGPRIDPAAGAILRHRRIGAPLSDWDITKLCKNTTSSFRNPPARLSEYPVGRAYKIGLVEESPL